jgi:hypothetical protein
MTPSRTVATVLGDLTYLPLERSVTRRPLLALTAATAALTLCAAPGTAAAATKAAGRGTSSVSVLSLSVAGHTLSLADLSLISDTIASPRISSVTFTPVTVDGTAYGKQSVNQSTSPATVGAVSAPAALAPVATLTSPALDISATSQPSNHAGAASLGKVKVLGLPVQLAGALDTASAVSSTAGASGLKTVEITNLALPSVADVLAALGLDLSKLPIGSLDDLVNALELVTGAITTAETAVDTAQAAVTAATADLATKTAALTADQAALTTSTAALQTILDGVAASLDPLVVAVVTAAPSIVTVAGYDALAQASSPFVTTLNGLVSGLSAAYTTFTTDRDAVAAAQALVDTAQATLTSLTSTLTTVVHNLFTLLQARLDATPLVSLDELKVSTRAAVTSASKGGQHAEVVGGTVRGLKVLGVDVIDSALGSSTLDLEGVTSSALAQVNGVIGQVTGVLSTVLSNVPGFPKLEVPAPAVGLLTKTTSTSIKDGFGLAATTVRALSITVPGITLPTTLALPGAAGLPAFDSVTQVAGQLTSAPLSLSVLTLRDQAAFRPAVAGTSVGNPGSGGLPPTGLPTGVAALSLTLIGCALLARRRLVPTA